MKKIYFLLCAIVCGAMSYAQTLPNAGMETWRNNTSGSSPSISIHVPISWYGIDSLVIADGEAFGMIIGAGSNWHAQIFQETTIKNSGTSSAKLMTLKQDTLGLFAGFLTNAEVSANVAVVIAGGSPASAITLSGGTGVTERITSVSAYVEYFPGIDSATGVMGGADTGLLTVQAISRISGYDSVVGIGTALIPPHSSFTQITANVVYADTNVYVDTVRIIFASSGGASQTLDSSTLYVDDVSMTGVAEHPVKVSNVLAAGNVVNVYPNPASDKIYFDGPQNKGMSYTLMAINGQVVATKQFSGKDVLDITNLPSGLYLYVINDNNGNAVQRGKVSVSK